ncbi:phytoene desaturase family protein [Nocardioides sp. GXZ039]|uniref:phytoene desaturase family protein n=1 Tax=Nocardioides sp. GXZ039 TaxID=3136018 RepID=UPI0030F3F410
MRAGTAYVVGAGPNGLTAAVRLAQRGHQVTVLEAGSRIGGGTRTSENTLPGLLHDDCSAFHPTALASPYLRVLDLERHGLEYLWPEIEFAHPLDDGRAGLLHRSLEQTAAGLGADGGRWRRLFAPLVRRYDDLVDELFQPVLHIPRHPLTLARFGLSAAPSPSLLTRRWQTEEGPALFGGAAAHLTYPLTRPLTSAVGLVLTGAAHTVGWPVARGGSRAITDALAARLLELGGRIETDAPVTRLEQVGDADAVLFDLAPPAVARLLGDLLPPRIRRAYTRYRFGPGAFKLDLAVEGPIPWANTDVGRAGTVHLGGALPEIVASEAAVAAGRMPRRPFVLVGQQYLADPSRSADGVNPVWAYAHVPAGYGGDASEAIIAQVERFAPGFRDRIVGRFSRGPGEMEAYNANYVGGDIATGANDLLGTVFRPRLTPDPYRTGAPGFYLCSAATPPGAGVHGMGGFHAANAAADDLEGAR